MPAKSAGFFPPEDLIHELKEFKRKRVNVEYACGNCCKRVTGGTLVEVGKDFIQLNGEICIITIIPGLTQPVIKKASVVVIPIYRICSVERPI